MSFCAQSSSSARYLGSHATVDQAFLKTTDVLHPFELPGKLLNSSEGEWLQESEEEHHVRQLPSSDRPTNRFDWRIRASSRVKKPEVVSEDDERQRFPKRKRLQGLEPDVEGLYYHAAQDYKSKCVHFPPLPK